MPQSLSPTPIEALYCEHHGWLQGWLRRKLGNTSDAADLAHDTFVRALVNEARHQTREELRQPRAYLATIANGLVISHWRRQSLERAWLETLAQQPIAIVPSLEQQALILETLAEIAALLDGLPTRVREIFLLSQLDGLTYPQIATQMGITVNIVQKAMTRAITQCYQALYAER